VFFDENNILFVGYSAIEFTLLKRLNFCHLTRERKDAKHVGSNILSFAALRLILLVF